MVTKSNKSKSQVWESLSPKQIGGKIAHYYLFQTPQKMEILSISFDHFHNGGDGGRNDLRCLYFSAFEIIRHEELWTCLCKGVKVKRLNRNAKSFFV